MKNIVNSLSLLFHSIRFRLALWFVLILALLLAVFSGLLFYMQIQELRAETLNRLQGKLERIESVYVEGGVDPIVLGSLNGGEAPLDRSDILVYFSPNGSVLKMWGPLSKTPVLNLASVEVEEHEPADETITLEGDDGRVEYVFKIIPLFVGQDHTGFMALGTPLDPRDRLGKLLFTLIVLNGFTLVFALAGGFWLADRAMRPVKTIAAKARSISETNLGQRFNLPQKDEIGQLAGTFDSMLARLESAFARQRQFTADASHELRTPLTIVNLETTRALSAQRSVKEYQRVLQVIHSENELMSHLVSDLLTLARMDAGREALHREVLDLSDIALEVVERLEPLAARQQVHLFTGELPEVTVLGDRSSLTQMLTNLVENAIKYTAQNGPDLERHVHVEAGTHPAQAQGWVRVSDTGPGISSEHLTHLFDRFYRVDKSRTREEDDEVRPTGSGLGLAIVDGITRLHNGSIEVQSELGKGSTFEVVFPLHLT
ncbi:MAG TPA: ATP-binding protein [Anaerolineales bacterium]|nr:ATP-binding protein [Anaerolineales bacterium]